MVQCLSRNALDRVCGANIDRLVFYSGKIGYSALIINEEGELEERDYDNLVDAILHDIYTDPIYDDFSELVGFTYYEKNGMPRQIRAGATYMVDWDLWGKRYNEAKHVARDYAEIQAPLLFYVLQQLFGTN